VIPDPVRSFCARASASGLLCCLLIAGAALGSDGIPVKITSDTSNNVVSMRAPNATGLRQN
jgi:hypothetical protein